MRKLNKNNGITLIALIITIIVMLILVGVSISMVVNGGLFEYAGKAVGDTENAIDAEQELANGRIQVDGKWYASIEDYLEGKIEIPEGLKVGDYVNYTPTEGTYEVTSEVSGYTTTAKQEFKTETDLEWRVWSIDEETGKIELISATAAHSLGLKGADGYNHAVDILNDMCKALYSNTKGATARSINVEDINAKTTYPYTTYTDYGNGYTPSNKQYPNIYANELGSTAKRLEETEDLLTGSEGVRNSDGTADYETYTGSSAADTLYATYTYYCYKPESYLNSELGINTASAGLINLGTTYWLASRCVRANSSLANFGVRVVSAKGGVDYYYGLCGSGGGASARSCACRPVVSLNSNVLLTKDEENSNESVTYWNIKY